MAKAKAETGDDPVMVEVRVLQNCDFGACNDVVEIPSDQVAGAKNGGLADDNADAVAYAKSLKA
jgi:hypothetical protein